MTTNNSTIRNVVLVHGGFVDGSGWEGVSALLTQRGYNVSIVQNPTITLTADVAATNQILDAQDGDVVLVGQPVRRFSHGLSVGGAGGMTGCSRQEFAPATTSQLASKAGWWTNGSARSG